MSKLLFISGSLRKMSFNSAALRVLEREAQGKHEVDWAEFGDIPLYNEDTEKNGFPPAVIRLRTQIANCNGILIATPEYNHSIPGGLKNAIDWASRPSEKLFSGKPIGIFGASPSMVGTARGQTDLRHTFVGLNGLVMNMPEVFISKAHEKFSASGELTDEPTREILKKFFADFDAWVARHQRT